MMLIALIFISFSVALHIFIWVLEQFLWDKPQGMKTFNMDPEFAQATRELAANQGLYNLMLAITMLVGVIATAIGTPWGVALCFAGAGSTVMAGIYLALTSKDKVKPAIMQLTPGLIGCIVLALAL